MQLLNLHMYFQANGVDSACLHNKKLWVYSHHRESYFKKKGKERQHSARLVQLIDSAFYKPSVLRIL